MNVFELTHYKIGPDDNVIDVIPADEDEADFEKRIGLFSSRENAEAVITRLRYKEGFRDWPGGFRIYETELDKHIAWEDGFFDWTKEPVDEPEEGGAPPP